MLGKQRHLRRTPSLFDLRTALEWQCVLCDVGHFDLILLHTTLHLITTPPASCSLRADDNRGETRRLAPGAGCAGAEHGAVGGRALEADAVGCSSAVPRVGRLQRVTHREGRRPSRGCRRSRPTRSGSRASRSWRRRSWRRSSAIALGPSQLMKRTKRAPGPEIHSDFPTVPRPKVTPSSRPSVLSALRGPGAHDYSPRRL